MKDFITNIYVYCTDFCITSANLMGITYEDFCALIFCLLWPLLTFVLLIGVVVQLRIRLQHEKRTNSTD